jgi:hypothetical protein
MAVRVRMWVPMAKAGAKAARRVGPAPTRTFRERAAAMKRGPAGVFLAARS